MKLRDGKGPMVRFTDEQPMVRFTDEHGRICFNFTTSQFLGKKHAGFNSLIGCTYHSQKTKVLTLPRNHYQHGEKAHIPL